MIATLTNDKLNIENVIKPELFTEMALPHES